MHDMVRRTKEEAEQTRCEILAAARRCFHARGVSATSLEHIAQEAGVTRGAIYWHFANKEELFKAMCDEVELPLMDRTDFTLLQDKSHAPLERLRNFMNELADAVLQTSPLRQTVEILNYKCEFVGPMGSGLEQHLAELREFREKLLRVYRDAASAGQLRAGLDPQLAAMESMYFLIGLLRVALIDEQGDLVRRDLRALIDAHVQGRCPKA
jgi:TetR/AcrR family transcriptional regulator, acrAB operon repressor